ncbi:hypothetical protein U1708_17720 [Sphingomonas sp. ZB1N12]|uniref:hypothetical protein n=1 Tax=Sphingomonas arabinosi TaxID=3096160 RepID=UPI002FC7F658
MISLITPFVLVPSQYVIFSLVWASGQFMTGVLFEWLRLATLRYSAPGLAGAADRKRVLVASYIYLTLALLVIIAVSWLFFPFDMWMVYAGAILFAIGQGTFDGNQAFIRAARENVAFARNWVIRAVLSIGFVAATSLTLGSGWWTSLALGVSFGTALMVARAIDRRSRKDRPVASGATGARWTEWSILARYGALAAVSGVIANAVPTLVRWALVAHLGKGGAAGALLAADLSQKALAVTGLAVNVVAMQNSFSAVDTGDAETIMRANRKQIAWAFAAVVPVGLFVWLLGNEVAQVLMRPSYRAVFVASIGPCALGAGLICIRLFAFDPLFYAFKKAGFSVAGAALSLALCGLGLYGPELVGVPALNPLTVFWGSAAAGLLASVAIALAVLRVRPPWSQLGRIALAAGAVVAVDSVLPRLEGVAGLVLFGAVLGLVYVAAVAALDIVGLRTELLVPAIQARYRKG